MPANWVLLAVPLALLCLICWVYEGIRNHLENAFLHAVYDGDRIQQWKSDRYNAKHNAIHQGRRYF